MRGWSPVVCVACVACGSSSPEAADAGADSGADVTSPSIPAAVCDQLLDAYTSFAVRCGEVGIPGAGSVNIPDTIVANIYTSRAEFDDHYCNNLPRAPGTMNLASELTDCANRRQVHLQ
jgi:hypothetical protein